ncbi:MAG: aminotransferase class III-fold pyridoxal phosphate-dependent enzyme [Gammaproteobacteria bacterium]|nr:aminotransferase class III-fold pyridoxal phosphate-dependent enzyme [Gammaproteobacteria bacterium]
MSYPDLDSKSNALFQRARKVLPDGGSRSTIRMTPYSIFIDGASGKTIRDVDGNIYIDFNNNYTSLIHGHSHPAIVEAVSEQLTRGTAYSFGSEAEVRLAELLCERSPNFDKIRFMNSGTEAVMNAIKAMRAHTGKPKIAKCEHAYHGSYDYAEVSVSAPKTDLEKGDPRPIQHSAGTPRGALDDVVVIPFNEPEIAERILVSEAENLAGVLIDPFGAGLGRVPMSQPFRDMLERVREQHHVPIIFDEVVAFRAGWSGMQGEIDITPDITALGKIIGGGFAVGAVAGGNDVMSVFEVADGRARLPHGGTFNANPVTMAAGHAAMSLMDRDAFTRLNALGGKFRDGIAEVLALTNLSGKVLGQYSVFALAIDDEDFAMDPNQRFFGQGPDRLRYYMLDNGYYVAQGLYGALSTVMDHSDLDPFCQTLLEGIRSIRGE